MKILLLAIGKTDEDYLITGIKKYVGRLGHYVSFEMKEIPDIRNRKTLSEEQQSCALNNISRKIAQRAFVHYDPIRAIKENIWQAKEAQPEFLKGDEPGDLVQVLYNGSYKICTRDTMKQFGLEWVRDW